MLKKIVYCIFYNITLLTVAETLEISLISDQSGINSETAEIFNVTSQKNLHVTVGNIEQKFQISIVNTTSE